MSVSSPQLALFGSLARTATPTAAEFSAAGFRGLHVVIDVTAVTSTPSVVPALEFYDALSGKWCTVLTGVAITATGTTVLKIYPGLTPSPNAAASDFVHGRMRLGMAHGDSDSITYSAAVHLVG